MKKKTSRSFFYGVNGNFVLLTNYGWLRFFSEFFFLSLYLFFLLFCFFAFERFDFTKNGQKKYYQVDVD